VTPEHPLGSHLKAKRFYHNQSGPDPHGILTVISTTSVQKPDWMKNSRKRQETQSFPVCATPTLGETGS